MSFVEILRGDVSTLFADTFAEALLFSGKQCSWVDAAMSGECGLINTVAIASWAKQLTVEVGMLHEFRWTRHQR